VSIAANQVATVPAFTVVIPARYASTRFPGKPLLDLGGKPMVVRVAERAHQSKASQVVVATDDERIAEVCMRRGLHVEMTRSDHATGTDRLSEVVALLGLSDDSIVVNVQGDEPMIPPRVIDATAAHLAANSHAAIATLVHPIHDIEDVMNPNVVKCVLDEADNALYFSRAPIPYARDAWRPIPSGIPDDLLVYRHIGMYAYRARFLRVFPNLAIPAIERFEALEQLRAIAHGFRIAVMRVNEPLPPGIDTPEDYEKLKARFEAR
jgi:3-deoxy-manno-octulosonate cytidylyltransferase (CMP-KDO synthetase)